MVGLFFASDLAEGAASTALALSDSLLSKVGWIPALPFLAFLVIIFGTRRSRQLSAAVSIGAMVLAACIAFSVLAARLAAPTAAAQTLTTDWITAGDYKIPLGVLVDNQSALMLVIVTFIGSLVQIYSTGYMSHEPGYGFPKFFAYLSLFTASMLFLVLAPNFVQIYMGWELVGLSSYLLIGFWYFKDSAANAAKKAFVVTRFGDLGFLAGILLIVKITGSVDFTGAHNCLEAMAKLASSDPSTLTLACVLVFCGAVGKSAQFPLHIWLPDAMEGPTPVSALIHAATMVAAGVYLVTRCHAMFAASPTALEVVAWIGAITAFMAATMGVVQNDIKRVMAYSTVSQLGYMFMALGVGSQAALVAANFHLVTHAFFKALLFLCAGSVIHAVHSNDMWTMGGLKKVMPVTHLTCLVGALALSGIPPLAGFWSKDAILASVAAAPGKAPLALIGFVSAFLTAFYVARMYFVTFWGEYRGGGSPEHQGHPLLAGAHGHDHHDTHGHDAADHASEHGTEPAGDQPAGTGKKSKKNKKPKNLAVSHAVAHVGHGAAPHESPAAMVGPLALLAVFAALVGFLNAPMIGIEKFQSFLLPTTEIHEEGGHLLLLLSIAVAASGWAVAYKLYVQSDCVASEARLRRSLGPVWTFVENKWNMDDLWAFLLRYTMFAGATFCDWVDRKIIDGIFVLGTGRVTLFVGSMLREEHSGKVQQYASMIVIAIVIVLLGIGVAEPSFILNKAQVLKAFESPH